MNPNIPSVNLNNSLITCLNCDKYHFGRKYYGGDCSLSLEITLSHSLIKDTFHEYIERKFPLFKGLTLNIGLFLCPQFIELGRAEWEAQKQESTSKWLTEDEMNVLKKLGIKIN